MLHVPTLYLDTSVIGGYFDKAWCVPTRELWQLMEAGVYRFVTSRVTLDELANAPQAVRELFARTFPDIGELLPTTDEAEALAAAYLRHSILPPRYTDDARQVAVCVLARTDFLVSWNFKHLVNVRRSDAFNGINLLQGYPPVRIVTPRELLYDDAADSEKL